MQFAIFAIDAYTYMVFAVVIISWLRLSDDNPIVSLLHTFTEPPLQLIRKVLPSSGGLDFSPMILIFLLYGLRRMLMQSAFF